MDLITNTISQLIHDGKVFFQILVGSGAIGFGATLGVRLGRWLPSGR